METKKGQKSFPCILCRKRTKPKDRKKCESAGIRRFLRKKILVEATPNDILCNKCRHLYHGHQPKQPKESFVNPATDSHPPPGLCSPPSISLPLQRTPSSHAYCFICKRPGPKLVVVSPNARFQAFLHKAVLVPPGSRCCPFHINGDNFATGALDNLQTFQNSLVNRTTILESKITQSKIQLPDSHWNHPKHA